MILFSVNKTIKAQRICQDIHHKRASFQEVQIGNKNSRLTKNEKKIQGLEPLF